MLYMKNSPEDASSSAKTTIKVVWKMDTQSKDISGFQKRFSFAKKLGRITFKDGYKDGKQLGSLGLNK